MFAQASWIYEGNTLMGTSLGRPYSAAAWRLVGSIFQQPLEGARACVTIDLNVLPRCRNSR